jgi:hypothetical protein
VDRGVKVVCGKNDKVVKIDGLRWQNFALRKKMTIFLDFA